MAMGLTDRLSLILHYVLPIIMDIMTMSCNMPLAGHSEPQVFKMLMEKRNGVDVPVTYARRAWTNPEGQHLPGKDLQVVTVGLRLSVTHILFHFLAPRWIGEEHGIGFRVLKKRLPLNNLPKSRFNPIDEEEANTYRRGKDHNNLRVSNHYGNMFLNCDTCAAAVAAYNRPKVLSYGLLESNESILGPALTAAEVKQHLLSLVQTMQVCFKF
jgi:hypothetical protein